MPPLHAVTGALGYSGQAITHRLLARGVNVRTLTNSPGRPNPFGDRLEFRPLDFDHPGELARSLDGVEVLFNTYWVRFNHRLFTFDQAVRNTRVLFQAARAAGVQRIVHTSIMNPHAAPALGYYRAKDALEQDLRDSGIRHGIIRPGVLFGRGDILINNIAWVIRHLPVFGVFGDGSYPIQPMHVDDFADLAVELAFRGDDPCADANGPETFTFLGLVEMLAGAMRIRRRIVRVSPTVGHAIARLVSPLVRDVILTREEITGLMSGLLASAAPSSGRIRLSDWARDNAEHLGRSYASELRRRTDRTCAFAREQTFLEPPPDRR